MYHGHGSLGFYVPWRSDTNMPEKHYQCHIAENKIRRLEMRPLHNVYMCFDAVYQSVEAVSTSPRTAMKRKRAMAKAMPKEKRDAY